MDTYNINTLDIFVNTFINKNIIDKLDLINIFCSYDGYIKEVPVYILKNNWVIFSQHPESIECIYGDWKNIDNDKYFYCNGGYVLFHFNVNKDFTEDTCENSKNWVLCISSVENSLTDYYKELFIDNDWNNFEKSSCTNY